MNSNNIWTKLNSFYEDYYNYYTNKEDLFLLEPFSSMIRLAMLSYYKEGTKIAITNNKIYVQEPNYFQGPIRWLFGSNRNELSYLLRPIVICKKTLDVNNKQIKNIFIHAIKGLQKLKISYNNESNMTCHCLQLYINYIENDDIESKEFTNIDHIETDEFTTKLYVEFKKLWTNSQIKLISNLLDEIEKNPDERIHLLDAISSIIDIKENQSIKLIHKFTKNLKKK